MNSTVGIDQRGGIPKPYFAMDLLFTDGRLEKLIGTPGVTGTLRGRATLSGTGDTIREALGRTEGRAGLVAHDGQVKRTLGAVLGHDLGKAIGAALRDPSGFRLVDPIRVGGNFSAPTLSAAGDPPGSKMGAGSIIKAVGKSLGGALGLTKKRDMDSEDPFTPVDCGSMERRILTARPPRS